MIQWHCSLLNVLFVTIRLATTKFGLALILIAESLLKTDERTRYRGIIASICSYCIQALKTLLLYISIIRGNFSKKNNEYRNMKRIYPNNWLIQHLNELKWIFFVRTKVKTFFLQFSFIFCNKTEIMPGYTNINFIF